jgi:hypothetical protein
VEGSSFISRTVVYAHNSRMDIRWCLGSWVRWDLWLRRLHSLRTLNRLWWLGLYESVQPPVLPWLFSRDYSHAIAFGMLRGIGGGQYSTRFPISRADRFKVLVGVWLTMGWAFIVFWLGYGINLGQELHTGVGAVIGFIIWSASMFFLSIFVFSVSRINQC